MSLFSASYWLKLSDKSVVSKSSLYYYILHSYCDSSNTITEGEPILCAKDISLNDRYVTVTDTRDLSTDYSVMLYPTKIGWCALGGTAAVVGAITTAAVVYLKRK